MAKRQFSAHEGEEDLNKILVPNQAEPDQGSPNTAESGNTGPSEGEAANPVKEELPAATTTESDTAPRDGKNMSAGQDTQGQEASGSRPDDEKAAEVNSAKPEQDFKDEIKAIMACLRLMKLSIITYPVVDLKALVDKGGKLCICALNRDVQVKHVEELVKSLEKDKVDRFEQPMIVCPARKAIEQGVTVLDEAGNIVTLDNPEIDNMYLTLDGQHRGAAAAGSGYKYGVDVMIIPCPKNVPNAVKHMNAFDRNWGLGDYRKCLAETKGLEDKLMEAEIEARKIQPHATSKFLNYALKQVRDAIRKSAILNGALPEYDEDTARIGMEILKALRLLNPDAVKCKLTTLEMLDAIFAPKADFNKKIGVDELFVKYLKIFMYNEAQKGFDPTDKDKVEAFILDFPKNFRMFVKSIKAASITDEQVKVVDNEIKQILSTNAATTTQPNGGSMFAVMKDMKKRESDKATLRQSIKDLDEQIKKAMADKKAANKQLSKLK